MHYNRGNETRVPCFKHNGGVPQDIKDRCPIYSGAANSESDGEELGSQLNVALHVAQGNDQRWSFNLRLPCTDGVRETVLVKVDNVRKTVPLNGTHNYEDVQFLPRRAKYFVEGQTYPSRLRRCDFDARAPLAFVFPVRASETSVRTRRLYWGFSYYVLTEADTQIPLESNRISPPAQTKDYMYWKCVRITLPVTIDDRVAEWFLNTANASIEAAPYKVRPLLGEVGERRVAPCFGDSQYVLVVKEQHAREDQYFLMVSKDVAKRQDAHCLESRVSVAKIASSEFCALGISTSQEDDTWPLSLYIDAKTWSEPSLPVAVFLHEGRQVTCTLGDSQFVELFAGISRRTTSIERVLPGACAAAIEYKVFNAFKWTREIFLLNEESECQRLVDLLRSILQEPENDVLLEAMGIGSLLVNGVRASQASPPRYSPHPPSATWDAYVALRKRTSAYIYANTRREGSWPHR